MVNKQRSPTLDAAARWRQVKDVLARTLDCPADERAAFLSAACGGDTTLHREVADLLNQSTGGLDICAGEVGVGVVWRDDPEAAGAVDSNVGRRVGVWTLGERLGAGGMGTVYLARRADGAFEQIAAVKLLRRGTDTEEVLRRFRAERQILARLDHPGIVRLLDGGATDDGLPFFALEHVGGQPITAYARGLAPAAVLRLFLKICASVQYAHERLIIHRDLKPANILVTADGEPKLLDFGIAKLLEEDNAEYTLPGQGRFTPAYASPEQAKGEPVTTASDVYALGALLYELLTGHSPHHFSRRRPSGPEIARVVGDVPAVRPSLATDSPALRRTLCGDLDNILLKALEKEAVRRYRTVGALAEDVSRCLDGRPVRARRATLRYHATKFVGRHKALVAALTAAAMVLAGGVASTAWQARRAEQRYQEVRRLTNSYLFEIHDAIRDLPGSTPARRLLVSRALEYLDRLSREASGDKSLQIELAAAYLQIGDVQGKPYAPNLGDSASALRSYTQAVQIVSPFAKVEQGSSAVARRGLSQAEENLGCIQSRLNRSEEATHNHRQALAIRHELLRQDPAHADEWRRGIAANYIGLGDAVISANRSQPTVARQRLALEHYRRALPICERLSAAHPEDVLNAVSLAKTCSRIATVLSEIGSAGQSPEAYVESTVLHRRALTIDEAILRSEPTNTLQKRRLADELMATSYLLAMNGKDLPEAVVNCRRALALMKDLANLDPVNAEAQQDVSSAYFVTGKVCQAQGDFASAAENYRQAQSTLELLIAEHPGNVETTFDLARVRQGLSEANLATETRASDYRFPAP